MSRLLINGKYAGSYNNVDEAKSVVQLYFSLNKSNLSDVVYLDNKQAIPGYDSNKIIYI